MSLPSLPRVILTILIIFIIYAVLTSPASSADWTSTAWGHTKDAAAAIGTFFDGLLES